MSVVMCSGTLGSITNVDGSFSATCSQAWGVVSAPGLSMSDAQTLSSAVLFCLALAWVFRICRRGVLNL